MDTGYSLRVGFLFRKCVCVVKGKGVGVKAVRRAVVKFP